MLELLLLRLFSQWSLLRSAGAAIGVRAVAKEEQSENLLAKENRE